MKTIQSHYLTKEKIELEFITNHLNWRRQWEVIYKDNNKMLYAHEDIMPTGLVTPVKNNNLEHASIEYLEEYLNSGLSLK